MHTNSSIIMASAIALILTASVLVFTLTSQAFAMLPGTGATSATPCPPACFGITLSPSVLGNDIISSLQPGQFTSHLLPYLESLQHGHTILGGQGQGLSATGGSAPSVAASTPGIGLSGDNGVGLYGYCIDPQGHLGCL